MRLPSRARRQIRNVRRFFAAVNQSRLDSHAPKSKISSVIAAPRAIYLTVFINKDRHSNECPNCD
ncbi:MAG TPA: hypothetical protein VNI84_20085 [Pyrinomonadaceae bacterium]|nr:hypothetical protein [Pyrinomonadaceae bacterium]